MRAVELSILAGWVEPQMLHRSCDYAIGMRQPNSQGRLRFKLSLPPDFRGKRRSVAFRVPHKHLGAVHGVLLAKFDT